MVNPYADPSGRGPVEAVGDSARRRRLLATLLIGVISSAAVAGGAVGWELRGGPSTGPTVLLTDRALPADSYVVEIDHPGLYDAEWSDPLASGGAVAVPAKLPCYVTFGQSRVVQSSPTAFVQFQVRSVRRDVVVALTLEPDGGSDSNPFVFEISPLQTVGGSGYFDSNGFSIRPPHGC